MSKFQGQLFQLLDGDSNEVGVIYTSDETISENFVEDIWQEYLNDYQIDVDNFVQFLNKKLSNDSFERVFLSQTFG
jgi:hypothetical protein